MKKRIFIFIQTIGLITFIGTVLTFAKSNSDTTINKNSKTKMSLQHKNLTAFDISNRFFKLLKSIRDISDFSPQNINRQTGIKVLFNDENRNEYGYGGNIAGTKNWNYNVFAYPYPSKNNKRTDTIRLSFDKNTENADIKEVCVVIDDYQQKLKNAGFKISTNSITTHFMVNGLILERNNIFVHLNTVAFGKNYEEIKSDCLQQISVIVGNK